MLVLALNSFSIYSELKICGKTRFFLRASLYPRSSDLAAMRELNWP